MTEGGEPRRDLTDALATEGVLASGRTRDRLQRAFKHAAEADCIQLDTECLGGRLW